MAILQVESIDSSSQVVLTNLWWTVGIEERAMWDSAFSLTEMQEARVW